MDPTRNRASAIKLVKGKDGKMVKRFVRKPLTDEQENILRKLYFKEKNFFGRDKLYRLAKETDKNFTRQQVMEWLEKQEVSQLFKPTVRTKTIKSTVLSAPYKQIAIDLIDMGKNEMNKQKWILTAIDMFSKMVWARAMPNKKAKTVATAMKSILDQMSRKPSSIRSDNGSEFIDDKPGGMKRLLKERGIKQVFSQPSKPHSNGTIERFNSTLKRIIGIAKTHAGRNVWVDELQRFTSNINKAWNRVTKQTPNEVAAGSKEDDKIVKERIKDTAEKQSGKDVVKFKVGDNVRLKLVLRNHAKVANNPRWTKDIYTIIKVFKNNQNLSRVAYQVKDNSGTRFARHYYNEDLSLVKGLQQHIPNDHEVDDEPDDESDDESDDIKMIISPSVHKKTMKGFNVERNSGDKVWLTRDQLEKFYPDMLTAFENNHKVKWVKKSDHTFTHRWKK